MSSKIYVAWDKHLHFRYILVSPFLLRFSLHSFLFHLPNITIFSFTLRVNINTKQYNMWSAHFRATHIMLHSLFMQCISTKCIIVWWSIDDPHFISHVLSQLILYKFFRIDEEKNKKRLAVQNWNFNLNLGAWNEKEVEEENEWVICLTSISVFILRKIKHFRWQR